MESAVAIIFCIDPMYHDSERCNVVASSSSFSDKLPVKHLNELKVLANINKKFHITAIMILMQFLGINVLSCICGILCVFVCVLFAGAR